MSKPTNNEAELPSVWVRFKPLILSLSQLPQPAKLTDLSFTLHAKYPDAMVKEHCSFVTRYVSLAINEDLPIQRGEDDDGNIVYWMNLNGQSLKYLNLLRKSVERNTENASQPSQITSEQNCIDIPMNLRPSILDDKRLTNQFIISALADKYEKFVKLVGGQGLNSVEYEQKWFKFIQDPVKFKIDINKARLAKTLKEVTVDKKNTVTSTVKTSSRNNSNKCIVIEDFDVAPYMAMLEQKAFKDAIKAVEGKPNEVKLFVNPASNKDDEANGPFAGEMKAFEDEFAKLNLTSSIKREPEEAKPIKGASMTKKEAKVNQTTLPAVTSKSNTKKNTVMNGVQAKSNSPVLPKSAKAKQDELAMKIFNQIINLKQKPFYVDDQMSGIVLVLIKYCLQYPGCQHPRTITFPKLFEFIEKSDAQLLLVPGKPGKSKKRVLNELLIRGMIDGKMPIWFNIQGRMIHFKKIKNLVMRCTN